MQSPLLHIIWLEGHDICELSMIGEWYSCPVPVLVHEASSELSSQSVRLLQYNSAGMQSPDSHWNSEDSQAETINN